jgi:hypothetical protein
MTPEGRDVFRARLDGGERVDKVNALLNEPQGFAKHDPDGGVYYVIGHASARLQLQYGIIKVLGARPGTHRSTTRSSESETPISRAPPWERVSVPFARVPWADRTVDLATSAR